jgi:hypothetical protein
MASKNGPTSLHPNGSPISQIYHVDPGDAGRREQARQQCEREAKAKSDNRKAFEKALAESNSPAERARHIDHQRLERKGRCVPPKHLPRGRR